MLPVAKISISDLHTNLSRGNAEESCQDLFNLLEPQLRKSQLLVIVGDFFDTSLSVTDQAYIPIVQFITKILLLCDELDVTVRLLRGTYYHDRNQVRVFVATHLIHRLRNDLRYFDSVSLEYIARFDMRVLYLPDDLPYESSDAVMVVVKAKMAEMGWDTVDYVYAHGYFEHVLPEGIPHKPKITFRKSQFKGIVTRMVLVGHVHHHSVSETDEEGPLVIFNGSPNRHAHGEQEPKGFVAIQDHVTRHTFQFIENKDAVRYDTLDYQHLEDSAEIVAMYRHTAGSLRTDRTSHLRVIHAKSDIRTMLSKASAKEFPHIRLTFKIPKPVGVPSTLDASGEEVMDISKVTLPTPDTLPSLVSNWLQERNKGLNLPVARIAKYLSLDTKG